MNARVFTDIVTERLLLKYIDRTDDEVFRGVRYPHDILVLRLGEPDEGQNIPLTEMIYRKEMVKHENRN